MVSPVSMGLMASMPSMPSAYDSSPLINASRAREDG
jgi:hypothetical protein